jgi:serine/threonine protein kinase/HEAT repeat protein
MARREDPFGTSRKTSTFVYSVMRTMGLPINHHELSVDLSIQLREHLPFLVHPEGDRLLYLWPFVVASEPGPQDTFGKLFVFEKQTRSNLNSIEYVGVAQRQQFELTEHSEHRDPSWLRERRASFPGRLAFSTPALDPLHREVADELVGKSFGDGRSYNIVRRLGRGGMGTVYVATDESGRPYAIKVLQHRDSRTQQRFKREINALGRLKSTSGIVGLIDWGENKDAQNNPTPYYVMEYADRGDLSTFIQTMCVPLDESKDPLRWDLEPRLKVLEDIARALAHLHELDVVHRDIKPENVLLMGDDTVRLADFGLAKALENDEHLTQKWSIVGTPDYMAPELLAGEDANKRSDVFAYGVLLFEVLLGRLPTRKGIRKTGDGGTIFDQSAIQAIPDVLRRTLLKCTRFEPAERYEDGKALFTGLTDGFPKIRRGKLRIRTEPSGAVVELNGKAIDQEVIDVESGVHVLSASKGNLDCPPKVVRVPPLATVEVVLVLEDPSQAKETSGERLEDLVASAAALESILPFLKATKMRIVTRSLGYGTAKGVEDENSLTAWLSMKNQLGTSTIAPLIELLESRDADTRMKALQFLLYYAVESPDRVDVKRIQARMREEEVPVILGAWINHLERSLQRNWPLLLDLLTSEQLGFNAVGIPNILRRLGSQPEVIDRLVTTLPSIPDTNTRGETVRALSGRHPRATEALLDRMANDPEQSVRGAAVYALADGAPAGVFDHLMRGLETDPAASVRTGCSRAMLILDRKRASLEFERLRAKGDPAVDAAIESAQV